MKQSRPKRDGMTFCINAANSTAIQTARFVWAIALAFAVFGLADNNSRAEDSLATKVEAGDSKPDGQGFVSLFNGRNLGGWTGLADYWSVRNGEISGHEAKETSKQTFLILSNLKVRNFELHFKYKFASPEGNSGLQFRSVILDPQNYIVGGYQADFDAKAQFDGGIYDEAGVAGNREMISNRGEKTTWDADNKRHVELLDNSDQNLRTSIKSGQWNDVVLTVSGNHVVYSINGRVMTDLVDDSPTARTEGILALQLHKGFTMDVRFRDLTIKLLP